ncbi:MAG: hypothetical protein WCS27_10875 [Victivallaceae bacterium]
MKKMLIAVFALCLGFSAMAEEWSAMDLGIWFGIPTSMKTANVKGFRFGLPITYSEGYVEGFELALFCAGTDDVTGLQMSCVALAKDVKGVQISLVNVCSGKMQGSQFGVVNSAGKKGWQIGLVNSSENAKFQFGLINLNKNGLWPFSFLVNFGKDTFTSSETLKQEAIAAEKAAAAKKGKK